MSAPVNVIDGVEFDFVHREAVVKRHDGSVERLPFGACEREIKLSLLPIMAVLKTQSEIGSSS